MPINWCVLTSMRSLASQSNPYIEPSTATVKGRTVKEGIPERGCPFVMLLMDRCRCG